MDVAGRFHARADLMVALLGGFRLGLDFFCRACRRRGGLMPFRFVSKEGKVFVKFRQRL